MNNYSNNKDTKKENNSSTIKYKGNVTIKYVDKNGKIKKISKHNEGKIGLFGFLSLCLTKSKNAQNYIPSRICLYNKNKPVGSDSFKLIRLSDIVLSYITPTAYYKNSQGEWQDGEGTDNTVCSKVKYTFLITPGSIINSDSEIEECNFLRLVSSQYKTPEDEEKDTASNKKYICAELDLLKTQTENGNLNETIQINTDSNILIYWELSFE